MRITCPQCQAGYDVDPEKIPPSGLRVRCPQCDRVFSVRVAQSTSTTMSGQPPVGGPRADHGGRAAPPGRRAGMTMVGMARPPAPAASIQSDDPVRLPGKAPPPEPPLEELFQPSEDVPLEAEPLEPAARRGAARGLHEPDRSHPAPPTPGRGSEPSVAAAGGALRCPSRRSCRSGPGEPDVMDAIADQPPPRGEALERPGEPDMFDAEALPEAELEPAPTGAGRRRPAAGAVLLRRGPARPGARPERAPDPFAALGARAAASAPARRGAGDALHGRWRGRRPRAVPAAAQDGRGRLPGPPPVRARLRPLLRARDRGDARQGGAERQRGRLPPGTADEWIAIGAPGPFEARSSA